MKPLHKLFRCGLISLLLLTSILLTQNVAAEFEGGRTIHLINRDGQPWASDSCDGFWHIHQGNAPNGMYSLYNDNGGQSFWCIDGSCDPFDSVHYSSGQNEDLTNGRTFWINVNGHLYTSVFVAAWVDYNVHGDPKTVRPAPIDIFLDGSTPNTKCTDNTVGGNQDCPSCHGMARYSVHSMLVSLNIQDTPLSYSPPRGHAIDFTVTYNQKESQQPATFNYSNLGPK